MRCYMKRIEIKRRCFQFFLLVVAAKLQQGNNKLFHTITRFRPPINNKHHQKGFLLLISLLLFMYSLGRISLGVYGLRSWWPLYWWLILITSSLFWTWEPVTLNIFCIPHIIRSTNLIFRLITLHLESNCRNLCQCLFSLVFLMLSMSSNFEQKSTKLCPFFFNVDKTYLHILSQFDRSGVLNWYIFSTSPPLVNWLLTMLTIIMKLKAIFWRWFECARRIITFELINWIAFVQ